MLWSAPSTMVTRIGTPGRIAPPHPWQTHGRRASMRSTRGSGFARFAPGTSVLRPSAGAAPVPSDVVVARGALDRAAT
jgi:hypothetical protein